ncbi:ketoacyl-ACP synthase III [Kurthia sibirica]|uniref:Beta-ketoacyl-[acyl-carrier-protein] synthase III n=1 Tax=Kurthia sibirica TaxID=202750 RepID=A0A2U3AJ26_9BACL|nr:ketoacyl-ACP synthase III [Kurthia sibirica]PWI24540.1 ketoacyl-ACP synthase III [Kurthia sibirica]GEK33609.1 3-oxoacyl-[acyl-carrier-protein] synthase 3 [Kurthia sibirica]
MQSKARITSIGTYVPERILHNDDLEKIIDTNDEWIIKRTGIKERRIAAEDEFASTLAFKAVENLIQRSGKTLVDVDGIIVSTTTADFVMPSVACLVQARFDIPQAAAFDFNTACSGFAYAAHIANGLITSGLHKKILLITTETMSKIMDYTDRATCILFGDGAAAFLLEYDEVNPSFIASHYGTNGHGGAHVYCTNLASVMNGVALKDDGKLVQNGPEVYKWASRTVPEGAKILVAQAKIPLASIDWFVPHSANLRMIQSICEKLKHPIEKTLTSVEYYGNTSSVSIPLALQRGLDDGRLQNGHTLLLYGFGSGLTYAGHIVKWQLDPQREQSF